MDTLYKLVENGVLELGDVFESCIRWLGWGLINLIAKLVNGIEKTTSDIYTLNGFFNSPEITQLIDKYKPIVWTILGISIGLLGFKIIFNRQQNRNELPSNILFSILVVMLLSTFMTKMNDITKLAITSAKNTNQSITNSLVKESLYDIYYLDTKDFDLEGEKNNISADNVYNIDINETLNASKVSNSDLFKKKIEFNENGDKKLVKLEKGWFKVDEMYYRYNIDFIPVIISLGAIGIAFVCIILKVARLMFELAFNKFFATLLAFADVSDGRKLKEMVKHIISIFIVLFITAILTNMYILYNSWITKSLVNNGLGGSGILKIMMIIGGAVAVIDGPNLVERILGIDAGLKSAWGTVMAGYGVTKGALNAGKGFVNGMSKLGNGLALGMAGAGGAMAGIFGNKDKSDSNSADNKSNNYTNKDNDLDSNKQGDSTSNNSEGIKKQDKAGKTLQEEMKSNKDNKQGYSNGETLQEEMKASKNNEANLNGLNDKFKEIEELKNNPNKDLNKPNINNNKENDLDNRTLQEEMKSNKDNKQGYSNGETLQEEMKASKNNEANLNGLNDKFKEIEELKNNPNKDLNKPNINNNKENDLDNRTLQEEMKSNKDNKQRYSNGQTLQEEVKSKKNGSDSRNIKENINPKNINTNNVNKNGNNNENNINNEDIPKGSKGNINAKNNNDVNRSSNENRSGNESRSSDSSKDNTISNENSSRIDVNGKMENRTIGEYIKDGVQKSKFVDSVNRAYNLGYNTTSKWNIKGRNKDKKGEKK